jgi:hypothetical protein
VRIRNVLYGMAAVAVLGGCADQNTVDPQQQGLTMPATPPAWTEPAAYKFTLKSSCGQGALEGTFQSVVKNGVVVQNVGLDAAARKALMLRLSKLVPTLGEIEAEVSTARRQGADEVVVEHDPADGHPTAARIDPDKDALGDEYCYEISDYSVG